MILSGKIAVVAGVAGAMLIAALGWQTWRLHNETVGRATAEANYSTCQALNASHKAQINAINEQAAEDIAKAERQALLAEDARRAALAHSARIAGELAAERGRLASVTADACIDQHAPDDVDSLFRARATDSNRNGNPDG